MSFKFRWFLPHFYRLSIDSTTGVRFLFTQEALKIPTYIKIRKIISYQLDRVIFKERMIKFVNSQQHLLVTEDVNNMIYLAENDQDFYLCLDMLKSLPEKSRDMRFTFGPVIMRGCHHLQLHDVAFNILTNKEFEGLFNQLSSFAVAMDLLYENGQYQKVRELFEILKQKQLHGFKFPANALILLFASCYKMNTPDFYKYAIQILLEAIHANTIIPLRAAEFIVALALKQNDPKRAMEILSRYKRNHFHVRNLILITLAELNRIDDVLLIMNTICKTDAEKTSASYNVMQQDLVSKREVLYPDVIPKLEAAIIRAGNTEESVKLSTIIQSLKTERCITSYSLEEALCFPIKSELGKKNKTAVVTDDEFDIE